MNKIRTMLFLLALVAANSVRAQAPTGIIAGMVRDPSGAAVTGAQVKLVSLATGLTRAVATSEQGAYSFLALLPGEYKVSAEVQGFRSIVQRATVEAGATTTMDFALRVGATNDSITWTALRRRCATILTPSAAWSRCLRSRACRSTAAAFSNWPSSSLAFSLRRAPAATEPLCRLWVNQWATAVAARASRLMAAA